MASLAPRSPSDSSAASAARPWLLSLMARRRAALVGDLAAGCREGALHDDQGGKGRPPWRLRLAAHVGLAVYALEVLEMARDGVQDDDPRWKTLRDVGDARDVLLHAYMGEWMGRARCWDASLPLERCMCRVCRKHGPQPRLRVFSTLFHPPPNPPAATWNLCLLP